MKVLLATTHVPFVRGGAEFLAENLRDALREAGHEAEILGLPFKWYPAQNLVDSIAMSRLVDVAESDGAAIDRVIGLKFPAYFVPHDNKVMWIMHQHRAAYDMWDSGTSDLLNATDGEAVRDIVRKSDELYLRDSRVNYTISQNVTDRLNRYSSIVSEPLYHPPPNADLYFCDGSEDYLFYPSRLGPMKRQDLVIKALAKTENPVKVIFAGRGASDEYEHYLRDLARKRGVADRIQWAGFVSIEEKAALYSKCLAVVYPPVDEDYGYISLEAMLSSKPVISVPDSGGVLEFVEDGATGIIAEAADETALARAMDEAWSDRKRMERFGSSALEKYNSMDISWAHVVEALTS